MSNQIVITSGAKVRNLDGVLTGSTGVVSSVPLGAANGVATLDSGGKVPVSQLPSSVVTYLGTWNAATNTPTLTNGVGDAGDMYICNVAGTVNFGAGPITFAVGDWVLYGSGTWQKSSGQNGTVTSVAASINGNAIGITGSPITTAGTLAFAFAGTNSQYVNGAGNLTTFPTLISSIGLSMPSAFSVSNSPLTANGTISVTAAGNANQYIRGDGTLAAYTPNSGGGGSSLVYYFNGGVASSVAGYEQMSTTANTGASADFSVASDGYIASFLTDSGSPNQLNIPAGNWNFEIYMSASSSGGNPNFYVELYKYNGSTFTLISSNSANPEGITNGTSVDLYTTALTVPATNLLATDRLAVRVYVSVSGRTITMHTQDSNLSEVITTFSTGITALNGLTTQVQYFQTGTSGTDFNISSLTDTHTFNLPTASSTKRGALSSSDWSTFNSKEPAIAAGTTSQYWRGDKTWQTLNTTAVTEGTNLYYTDARARGALSFTAGSGAYNSTTGVITIPTNNNQITNGANYITLTSLSATTPLSYNNITGAFSISQATTSTNGYLSSTDWNTFNNKQSALTFGNLASNDTSVLTISGGTGAVIGTGATITINNASATNGGIVSTGTQTFAGNKTFTGLVTTYGHNINKDATTGYGLNIQSMGSLSIAGTGYVSLTSNSTSALNIYYNGVTNSATLSGASLTAARTFTFPDSSGTFALTSNLSSYVPYTGATSDVNLGNNYSFLSNSIFLNGNGGSGAGASMGLLLFKQYPESVNPFYGIVAPNYSYIYPLGLNKFVFNFDQGYPLLPKKFIFDATNLPTDGTVRNYTMPNVDGTISLGTGASGQVAYWNGTNTQTGSNSLFWDATNIRLGINTASPIKTLDVNGEIYVRSFASFNSTDVNGWYASFLSSGSYFAYMGSTAQFAAVGGTATDFGLRSQNALAFYTGGGNERFRISSTGAATFSSSIQGGSSSATNYAALQIHGASTSPSLTVGTAADVVFAMAAGQELAITASGTTPYGVNFQARNSLAGGGASGTSYPIVFNPLGGNVGIGTTNPTYQFVVSKSGATGLEIDPDNGTPGKVGIYAYSRSGAAYKPLHFEASQYEFTNGNVLINTTSTTNSKLIVSSATNTSSSYVSVFGNSSGGDIFLLRGDGLVSFPTTQSTWTTGNAANAWLNPTGGDLYRSTSSIKYKKNVENYTKGLAEVMRLRPVSYEGKHEVDAGKTFAGLIAEEVHELGLTEFVQYAEDGSPDALAYQNMVALLTKAIQELSQQNQDLKSRLDKAGL